MKAHLEADAADEQKAINTYGKRQVQHPKLASMYSEMQSDEKDHNRRLTKVLQGLKRAKS
jgi:rubrerythrin